MAMPAGRPMKPRKPTLPLAALAGISPSERKDVIEHLDEKWCAQAFDNLQRAHEAIEAGRSHDARNYIWNAGVSTDKVFAIREIPTHVVSNIHEYRISVGDTLNKLHIASQVLAKHQMKGYALPAAGPALPPRLSQAKGK